ncbi:hypothetical protein C6P40_000428 [Pichia californica]|uniref:Uncharacterized protein n=1 Tax=Pichia californica TaxID=460514 RepID=A0A9P7BGK1_9ASCO|nr:hypothetical protein C6P40_000428 [[Candida] californica]
MTIDKKPDVIPAITGDIVYKDPLFIMPYLLEPYKVGILSYASSMLSTTAGYPLDSIKTRMQTHSYKGAIDCLTTTIKTEGIRGLFRGMIAPLISTAMSRSMTVSIYTDTKPYIANILPAFNLDYIQDPHTKRFIQNFPVSFLSGIVSGATISLFACPFELTKIFQQIVIVVNKDTKVNLNSTVLPTKVIDVARNIVKYEGWLGLYSGYRYHIVRDSLSAGFFYSVYETMKLQLQLTNAESDFFSETTKPKIDALCVPLSGAMAGCIAWGTIYPLDTIKSRYQRDILGNIIRQKLGLSKLPITPTKLTFPTKEMYRGFAPSITRSVCVTMIFFSAFEYLMKNIA